MNKQIGTLRIGAVVVAWNRCELLVEVLDGLAAQTRPLDDVIVVDNASTDATASVIAAHPVVTDVITMARNLGGAGGFAAGIARALTRGCDLVWIMDDDTIADVSALEGLLAARDAYQGTPALLAARANWSDGREHPMNKPRYRPFLARKYRQHAAEIAARPIRTASFVAVLFDTRAIREVGLPQAAYFLWNDDFEYTGRILRHRIGLYVPQAVVEHRTKVFGNSTADPGSRFVNEVRNKIWTFTRSKAFNPVERLAYGGRTLGRWLQLLSASSHRQELVGYLWQGIRQGLSVPPTTTQILADTVVGEDVAKFEETIR